MPCDLVGPPTDLAARPTPRTGAPGFYLDEASAAVTGLGGHVLKKHGDGLMALFGYPAGAGDAERAVRAALAIQRARLPRSTFVAPAAPAPGEGDHLDSGQVVVDGTGEVFGDGRHAATRAPPSPAQLHRLQAADRRTARGEDRAEHALKAEVDDARLHRSCAMAAAEGVSAGLPQRCRRPRGGIGPAGAAGARSGRRRPTSCWSQAALASASRVHQGRGLRAARGDAADGLVRG